MDALQFTYTITALFSPGQGCDHIINKYYMGYTWYIFCHLYKGDNFYDFLLAFLHTKKCPPRRKEFVPEGSFDTGLH